MKFEEKNTTVLNINACLIYNRQFQFIMLGNYQHHDIFTYQSRRVDAATHCRGRSRSPAAALAQFNTIRNSPI